jgi:hypothetical protein
MNRAQMMEDSKSQTTKAEARSVHSKIASVTAGKAFYSPYDLDQ